MAILVNPITTVLLTQDELDSGEYDRFPFKYVLQDDGSIIHRTNLTLDRYMISKEASVPGLKNIPIPGVSEFVARKSAILGKREIQALAYGIKIPYIIFQQIEQFFKDVMKIANYEAQAFILWNDSDREYRIMIPEQSVTQGSVKYDIKDELGEHDTIIMDIHSHNVMSAFFSSVDDADDVKNPWISGVIGKITPSSSEHLFRFNDGRGRNEKMELKDIFEVPDNTIVTPKEWFEKVNVPKTTKRLHSNIIPSSYVKDTSIEARYPNWNSVEDIDSMALEDFLDAEDDFDVTEIADEILSTLEGNLKDTDIVRILNAVKDTITDSFVPISDRIMPRSNLYDSYSRIISYYTSLTVTSPDNALKFMSAIDDVLGDLQ